MPAPPKESIGGRIAAFMTTKTKDSRKFFDFIMASTIFVLVIIELISLYLQSSAKEIPREYWNYYALKIYPLLNTVAFWFVSLFFLVKILRYKSCIDTKIMTWLYFLMQSMNLIAIIFKSGFLFYSLFIYHSCGLLILVLIFIKILRWVFSK